MGTASRVCTSCDTPVPDDATFCPNCGEATTTGIIGDEQIDQEQLGAALIDRYWIQQELGRGGMATVYLARDVKHDRQVAVKVMLPKLAVTLGARRFLQEIQVAAKLQHPHIVPLHDSGDAEGFLYYVMPYVEGESLRARLKREPQLPIDDALQITREVAEALDYAHETGVVHRDIKPENILLSRGHALVADFGIAKAVSSAGGSALTSTGISVGTPAYMSPEQAGGDPNIDHRADIYSLGCVLYEMLAGEPPFTGPNVQAIIAKHAIDRRPSVRTVRDTVPETVDAAIKRAMAKAPADRFRLALEFAWAAKAAIPGSHRPMSRHRVVLTGLALAVILGVWAVYVLWPHNEGAQSIAVLPCANLSRDPGQQYVSDGVAEEIIVSLTTVGTLPVRSWLSVQRYRDTQKSSLELAEDLRVTHLVRCAVLETAGEVRVRAQLIDAERDQVVWFNDYRGVLSPDNIYDIQSDLAHKIADALGAEVVPEAVERLSEPPTRDLEALNLYRLGRHFWGLRTAEGLLKSTEYYAQAIARDSTFALPYVGLAEAKGFLGQVASLPPRQFMPEVKELVLRALEINEELAEAHSGLGQVLLLYDWDWPSAHREFRRATQLEPSSARAQVWYAQSLSYVGRHREAIAASEQAVALDPTLPFVRDNLAFRLYYARDYRRALDEARQALELDPNHWVGYWIVGMVHTVLGEYEPAIAAYEESFRLSGNSVVPLARLGHVYAQAGRRTEASQILGTLKSRLTDGYIPAAYIALVHLGLGDNDQALAWLRKAYDERDINIIWYLGGDPTLDPLSDNPGFLDLRAKVGFDKWP